MLLRVLVQGLLVFVGGRPEVEHDLIHGPGEGGPDVARDPVCGMQVDTQNPGAILQAGGQAICFCSGHCLERYGDRVGV